MSNRNLSKAFQTFTREVTRLCRSMTKGTIDWLLRSAFVMSRGFSPNSGIVLPTAIMLILVVSLSVGALTYRAYTRNIQAITSNQQRVIYNAATPAIDRARSKLEFMFDSSQDKRYPTGNVPEEKRLASMMRNDGKDDDNNVFPTLPVSSSDTTSPYLLPDETAVELTGTDVKDNAWSFRADTDGNGSLDATVVYSIIFRTPTPPAGGGKAIDPAESQRLLVTLSDKKKAKDGVVRHGPLTTETGSACQLPPSTANATATSVGWFNDPTNTSVVRKNFQVDVLVVPDSAKSAATTIEFHQDREISKGNKWGAWFRNDLEVFPGPPFRFNGAMHTEGNLIVGGGKGQTQQFQSYLISSKFSCLYPPIDNSEISITTGTEDDKFQGAIVAGTMGKSKDSTDSNGGFVPHYQKSGNYETGITIDSGNDTVKEGVLPKDVYSDPVAILTQDKRKTKINGTNNSSNYQAPTYDADLQRRIQFKKEPTPYIDDLSRADKRWGPKSTYPALSSKVPDRADGSSGSGSGYGYAILPTDEGYASLTKESSIPKDVNATDLTDEGVGTDGYWESRARNEGLRILVGERLELGNPFGWVTPRDTDNDKYISPARSLTDPTTDEREGDPLYPPEVAPYPVKSDTARISHLQQQRRTLRDNLAAVQATALYHTDFINQGLGPDYPFACLATTAHPGTPTTLRQSTNFVPTRFNGGSVDLLSDFFSGRGTNGWEFEPPAGDVDKFTTAIVKTEPLGIALRNLAHFAGDPDGAFPPRQDSVMHPYPALSMWGNFSNLRRALDLIDSGTPYKDLSTADKTYIHTASCTVGMLAYEIDTVQKFDPTNAVANNTNVGLGLDAPGTYGKLMLQLGTELYELMDEGTAGAPRVLPPALTRVSNYKLKGTEDNTKRNPRDYYNVPPEAYIEALRQKYTEKSGDGYGVQAVNNSKLRMAELIMLNFQIRRDRTFGFRPSPSFGHYAVQLKTNTELAVYPSACDPDLFAIDDSDSATLGVQPVALSAAMNTFSPSPLLTTPTSKKILVKARLGLSRLCGALNIPEKASYDLTTGYSTSKSSQARPVVMPKFPALYYIFPEQPHGLAGSKKVDLGADPSNPDPSIPDFKDEYDTRQPGTFVPNPSELTFLGLTKDDKESYVIDSYVTKPSVAGSYQFTPVQTSPSDTPIGNVSSPNFASPSSANATVPLSFPTPSTIPPVARFPDENRQVFPTPDLKVNLVAIKPRNLPGFTLKNSSDTWRLPSSTTVVSSTANIPTNIIHAPSGTTELKSTPVAVPFLDRAFFDGRQLMLARTLDLDLGMMRSYNTKLTGGQRGEPLLPMSGIVYAFREDSVREDAIARPSGARMNARNPVKLTDPALTVSAPTVTGGISTKAVDYLPDPSRRIHGFRLRNGRQVKRDKGYESGKYKPADNYRGLSFFTDQPLYIQGDLNRHQTGDDDTNGKALEEFSTTIRGKEFSASQFYDRSDKNGDFASLTKDRWRPTELLADSISILSDNFCDGSISDMFVSYDNKGNQIHPKTKSIAGTSDRSIYDDSASQFQNTGLYGLGCKSDSVGHTSFKNSDRPDTDSKLTFTVSGKTGLYDWLRENPNLTSYNELAASNYDAATVPVTGIPIPGTGITMPVGDYATPIKISRSGLPILSQPSGFNSNIDLNIDRKLTAVGPTYNYGDTNSPNNVKNMKFGAINEDGQIRGVITASSLRSKDPTNINAIVVSGIVPSQPGNSYGGLHNFPRFLEIWGTNTILDYAGSFLQLSFSNYATAPFQMVAWEYGDDDKLTPAFDDKENLKYYDAPNRLWGYDVALQLAPAGPAASRFVAVKTPRNEFYSEPQINDPYIQNLCLAAKADVNKFPGAANLNCTN